MSKVSFNSRKAIAAVDQIVNGVTETLTDVLFKDIKRRSPVRSGLFKRSWAKRGKGRKFRIVNPQPYGPALEAGRSPKAREGVMRPAIKNIKQI
tara:strand:+ start:142 stop:423 length:282 start_codon:yes stop_codon:yes gene_type:complete